MNRPSGGAFYDVVRACSSEGRSPSTREIERVAVRIWNEALCRAAGREWAQVVAGSADYRRAMAAALAALGVCTAGQSAAAAA